MVTPLEIVDLFCGAGGTSTGILKAAHERLKRKARLTAVNHWPTAINTHSLNHPDVHHLCENVENIHPRTVVRSGRLHLLAASCECTFHSNARGGGPCNEQSRSQPWQLIRWATDINVENILMENVREFMNWGPLHRQTKRPTKSRKGEYFKAFVNALIGLGYNVEFKIQSAADFGDPTSRQRLMLIARKGAPVIWPEPTHGEGRANPHRTARECIDWDLKGRSIFDRKRPLCQNTLRRIVAGLRKFGGPAAEPFIVLLRGTRKGQLNASAHSLDSPLPTITAGGGHLTLCEPFIASYHGGNNSERTHSINDPLPTQDTSNRFAVVEPFITHLTHHGPDAPRCHSVDNPLPTVTGAHRGEMALVEPILVQTDQTGGNGCYARPVDQLVPTIVSKQNMLLVQPFVVKYYGSGENHCSVDEPLATVTTRDRFALVECNTGRTVAELDIRTRMLQPHELAAAHSFPRGYRFVGNKGDQTKQIGNSVPVELAAAHAEAALS
jgi:DNA (cytosine-5)-methyltransferase 1